MKANSIPLRTLLVLFVLGFSTLILSSAAAETTDKQETRFDFKFEGGNAKQLQKAVESLEVNFIVPDDADKVRIPEFTMRSVTANEMFSALDILVRNANPDYSAGIVHPRLTQIWVLEMSPKIKATDPIETEATDAASARDRINRVAEELRQRRQDRSLENQFKEQVEAHGLPIPQTVPLSPLTNPDLELVAEPINISEQLKRTSIEGISSLIQSTIAAKSSLVPEIAEEMKIDIKFHRETKVIILSGQRRSVALAKEALAQILFSSKLPVTDAAK